jgi:ABC-type multidrug transport system fused ATPase/permease subunit
VIVFREVRSAYILITMSQNPQQSFPPAESVSLRLLRLLRLPGIGEPPIQQGDPTATDAEKSDLPTHPPRSMLAVLWPLARPYRGWIILAVILNAIHGIAMSVQTLLPTYILDHVMLDKSLSSRQAYILLFELLGLYLVSTIFMRMLMWHLSYRIFTRVRERVVFELRSQFFRHVNHLCVRFHNKYPSGELFNFLFGSPLAQVQGYFNHVTLFVPGAIFALIWTIAWVGMWDWLMCVILLASVLATVFQMRVAQANVKKLWKEFQSVESKVSGHVSDLIRGARHVKLYAIEGQVIEDFESRATALRQHVYHRDVNSHVQHMRQEGLGYLCFAVLCGVGVWRYFEGVLTVGQYLGYVACYFALQWPLQMLFQMATLHSAAQSSLERIDSVLQTASSTPDPINPSTRVTPEAIAKGLFRSDFVIKNVNFGYTKEQPVLKNINLTIPYGQHVALVGPSGGGKSTLSQLLMRFYDPDQGTITLAGVDLRDCVGTDLRKRFGVVPQDPFIFRTSLRENLRVVRPEATEEQLLKALELANALEFVKQAAKGLDTPVGEGGSTLSGGQRQRLAIARALLADPDIFILDEATSALDSHSERLIQQAIETTMKGRTALIIAHRLATVKHCDRILLLQDGCIAQDGTYDELVAMEGPFRDLVMAQQLRS